MRATFESEVWRPRNDGSGYLGYVGQRTLGEALALIETHLRATVIAHAGESLSLWDTLEDFQLGYSTECRAEPIRKLAPNDDFPSCRWVAVYAVEGSCEGHYVHVDAMRPRRFGADGAIESQHEDRFATLFVGKTFYGLDVALEVVTAVTPLFHR